MCIIEVVISGMELYIPHTFSNAKAKKPWFNSVLVLSMIERRLTNDTIVIHLLKLMSYRNRAKFILQLTKNSFFNRKCHNLSKFNSFRNFWHLANNISNNFTPLLQPDGSTAVSSFSKAELFAQTFATNSSLDDTGRIFPTPPPSDYFIPKIKILHYDVFHALSGLDSRKNYGSNGILPIVLKTVLSSSLLGQTLLFVSFYFYLSFLLEVCSHSTCS